jgi:hypothetical protein
MKKRTSVDTVSSTITPLMPLCWQISGVSEPTRPETATTSGSTLLALSKIAAAQSSVDMSIVIVCLYASSIKIKTADNLTKYTPSLMCLINQNRIRLNSYTTPYYCRKL